MAGVARKRLDSSGARTSPVFLMFYDSKMAGVAGLEPTTPGFGDQCSTN